MKRLLGIVVLSLFVGGSGYTEIINLKCNVIEQKLIQFYGADCADCAKDDGLSFDIKNKKILTSPFFDDMSRSSVKDFLKISFTDKYIYWRHILGPVRFKFNRYTYELEHVRFLDSQAYQEANYDRAEFIAKYQCKLINKI